MVLRVDFYDLKYGFSHAAQGGRNGTVLTIYAVVVAEIRSKLRVFDGNYADFSVEIGIG